MHLFMLTQQRVLTGHCKLSEEAPMPPWDHLELLPTALTVPAK